MDDILAQLTAAIDEDERVALAAAVEDGPDWTPPGDADHIFAFLSPIGVHKRRHDPARVLRWVAAAREVLADHEPVAGVCDNCSNDQWAQHAPCPTVRALAGVYGIGEG